MSADEVALLYAGLNTGVNVTVVVDGVIVTYCALRAHSTEM
jgi:hypothetical protein